MSSPNSPAFVWFSCGRDKPLLELSMASVRRHYPGAEFYVVSDSKDPAAAEGATTIRGANHGKTLNGIQCVAGQLRAFLEVAAFGARQIIKIDSDVLCSGSTLLPGSDTAGVTGFRAVGTVGGRLPYCSGAVYCVHARALAPLAGVDVRSYLERHDLASGYIYGASGWHEDQAITTILPAASGLSTHFHSPSAGFGFHSFANGSTPRREWIEFGRKNILKSRGDAGTVVEIQRAAMARAFD